MRFFRDCICFFCISFFLWRGGVSAQTSAEQVQSAPYRRSSLYSLIYEDPGKKFSKEIDSVFLAMPTPDKYEDHNLSLREIPKHPDRDPRTEIEHFLYRNQIGKQMVAKWFNRNPSTGTFDLSLVSERGLYNASSLDVEQALLSTRGYALLADAGEELIQNTFVIVHDISYIDKEEQAKIAASILTKIAIVAGAYGAISSYTNPPDTNTSEADARQISYAVSSAALLGAGISDLIAGFSVKTRSYLYQLDWNDEVEAIFYQDYWCDTNTPETIRRQKKLAFENCSDLFKLKYIGQYKARSEKTVLKGLHNDYEIITKVCVRALDKNISMLQKKFDVFKVKTPLYSYDGKFVYCKIGKKEGVTPRSKYEVLQILQNEDGKTRYKRAGLLKAVKSEIWDNRYMATEEAADQSDLKETKFKVISGGNFYPGMLIRQKR